VGLEADEGVGPMLGNSLGWLDLESEFWNWNWMSRRSIDVRVVLSQTAESYFERSEAFVVVADGESS
jgi:hypothetical protein